MLNHSHRLRSEGHFSDFEFEVEQVIADGFEDGQSLDIAEVEPVLGNFEITADFFSPMISGVNIGTLGISSRNF